MTFIDPSPRRIGVFRALHLGDLLCAIPALRALRAAYPDAAITLIGLPWAKMLVDRYRYIDDFLEFPGFPGLPERSHKAELYPVFLRAARRRGFDLTIQMHGSGELTNALVASFGARRMLGFHTAPYLRVGTQTLLPWDPAEQEVRRYLRLVSALGIPVVDDRLDFPVTTEERREAKALLDGSANHYVCVHPGAGLLSRRWPAERFAQVADALAARGLKVVVTGTKDEASLAGEVIGTMRHPALDCTAKTTPGTLAALVERARLVVCNDTGMSHFAAAVRTPSVVISSGADVRRWRPLDERRHRVLWHDTPCRPCAHDRCPTGHECALGVTVDAVMEQAVQLLGQEHARAA